MGWDEHVVQSAEMGCSWCSTFDMAVQCTGTDRVQTRLMEGIWESLWEESI